MTQRYLIWVRVRRTALTVTFPRETREGPFSSLETAEAFAVAARHAATTVTVRIELEPLSAAKLRCLRGVSQWASCLRSYEALAVPVEATTRPGRNASALFSVTTADVAL